jgi:hypothetical protein
MRAILVVLACCLTAAPAYSQKKVAAAPAAKAKPAAPAAKPEDAPLPPEAQKKIALIEPAAVKGMARASMKKLLDAVEEDLKAQGFEVIPPAQVTAMHLKRKLKLPACADAPECLAKVGKIAGAGYLANISITPAAKNYVVKLSMVDTADASVVFNRMGMVSKATDALFVETIKKQVPFAASALGKRIAEKQAVAVAPEPKPTPKPVETAKIEPTPRPEEPRPTEPIAAVPSIPLENPSTATANPEPVTEVKRIGPGAYPWVMVGAGVVAVGVGVGVFGSMAKSAINDYKAGNDPAGARTRAKRDGLICDVTAGVGAAVALAGAGILIFYPREERIVTVSPTVGPSGAGIAVSGGF